MSTRISKTQVKKKKDISLATKSKMGSLLCRRSPIYSPTLPDCYQIPIRPFTPEASHQGEFGPNASQSFVIWSRHPFLFSCSSIFNLLFNFFYYLIQKKEREQKGPFPQIFIEHDPCTRFLISIADDLRLNHPIFSYLSRLCLAFFCAPPFRRFKTPLRE